MKSVRVMFDLTSAWEEWICDVPDDADLNNLDFGEMVFVSMEESGNDGMMITDIEEI